MGKTYRIREQTRMVPSQVTAHANVGEPEGMFADLLEELRQRFPQIQFSKAQHNPQGAAIYVYDMDFYFSEPFTNFLDEIVAKMPYELVSGLDFYPVEAPASLVAGHIANTAAKGVVEVAARIDPAEATTALGQNMTTNCGECPLDDLWRAA